MTTPGHDPMATALNALTNATTEPVTPEQVMNILHSGDGPSHLVRALFGDCALETLDRLAMRAGLSSADLRAAARAAREKHGAVNAEWDAAEEF